MVSDGLVVEYSQSFTKEYVVVADLTPNPTNKALEGLMGDVATHMEASVKAAYAQTFRDTDPVFRMVSGIAMSKRGWSDEAANLEQLEYPVAIIHGAEEKIIFPGYLERVAIGTWRDEIIKISAASHCPQLDRPESLADLIHQYAKEIFISAGS